MRYFFISIILVTTEKQKQAPKISESLSTLGQHCVLSCVEPQRKVSLKCATSWMSVTGSKDEHYGSMQMSHPGYSQKQKTEWVTTRNWKAWDKEITGFILYYIIIILLLLQSKVGFFLILQQYCKILIEIGSDKNQRKT